jgi:hypothetical protein
MNEVPVADIHADMRDAWSDGVKEDEIPRAEVAAPNVGSHLELRPCRMGKLNAPLSVQIAREPGAVKPAPTGAPIDVRGTTIGDCRPDDIGSSIVARSAR